MFDFDEMEEAEAMQPPRVWAFSDLHTDYAANLEWIQGLPRRPKDVLIVAGDVSHKVQVLRDTLTSLKDKFREVFFCPGNHDLWLDKDDGCTDSLEKLKLVEGICAELGVRTEPAEVGGVLFVPVHSWYEPGFDEESDVTGGDFAPVEKVLRDFRMCTWPVGLSASDSSLAEYMDTLNGDELRMASAPRCPVISFSHYLPRPELLPEKRNLFFPDLAKAVGSRALRSRVERLTPLALPGEHVHVFGHTHYGWAAELGGVRYLQAAVGSPQERKSRSFALALTMSPPPGELPPPSRASADLAPSSKVPHVVSNCSMSTMASWADADDELEDKEEEQEEVAQPVLVFDPLAGTKVPQYRALWSDHYAKYPRTKERRWLYANGPQPAVLEAVKSLLVEGERVTDAAVQAKLGTVPQKDELSPKQLCPYGLTGSVPMSRGVTPGSFRVASAA